MPDYSIEAQQVIQHERTTRNYAATTGPARPAYGIAGIPMPRELEAYVAETTCTVQHENKGQCLWIDWAFRLPDGSFRVVLQNDLVRPGMMIEESVQALFAELQQNMVKNS